ncbi:hypothetical protein F0249_12705 [Vibrio sp. 03-59-1]|uniref:hypothetical protein n=1 Tax=Vibrio sp. 03-59-1 TaxID=2607607 RepID=UPI001493B60E|nr:hypothetical protein [Vibrio sp. 03-59-1]NOH84676.1 hypothetical protein [Vibrio sp. 03-59-1]
MSEERVFDEVYRGFEINPSRKGMLKKRLDDLIRVCGNAQDNHGNTTAVMFKINYPYQALNQDGKDVFNVFLRLFRQEMSEQNKARRRFSSILNESRDSSRLVRYVYVVEESLYSRNTVRKQGWFNPPELTESLNAVFLFNGNRFSIEGRGSKNKLKNMIIDVWENILRNSRVSLDSYDIDWIGWYKFSAERITDDLFLDYHYVANDDFEANSKIQVFSASSG